MPIISSGCAKFKLDKTGSKDRAIRVRLATSIQYDTLMKNRLMTGASLKLDLPVK